MINVYHNGELVAQAKTITVVNNYFRFKHSHNLRKENKINRSLFSKKFNITVVLIEEDIIWQKNQSIVFLKKLEPKE
ncbi:MAG: hypothetical protein ACK53T_07930 [Planctomycetota bacterium]|jgi:hypothetical protein